MPRINSLFAGVAFDLDGTSIDTERQHYNAWCLTGREIGVRLSVSQALQRITHFIGGPDHAIAQEFFALANGAIGGWTCEEFIARKHTLYKESIRTACIVPRPGFFRVWREFRDAGIRMSVGTALPRQEAEALIRQAGLGDAFLRECIVCAEDVQAQKPAPDCFLETARRMGIAPHQQVVFEDSPRGVQSGVAAGSRVIGMPVYAHEQAVSRLKQAGAVKIYTDWKEICVPDLLEFLDG